MRKQVESVKPCGCIQSVFRKEGGAEDVPEERSSVSPAEEEAFTGKMTALLRREKRRFGIRIGASVLAALLLAEYLLPRLVSLFFYDPAASLGCELALYTELFRPDFYRTEAYVRARGYGEYDLLIPAPREEGSARGHVFGSIVRGQLVLYGGYSLLCTAGLFEPAPASSFSSGKESVPLTENGCVRLYAAFAEPLRCEDFLGRVASSGASGQSLWCAVENGLGLDLGFFLGAVPSEGVPDEAGCIGHLCGLMGVLNQHPLFLEMTGCPALGRLSELSETIREEGLLIKGFTVTGGEEELEALAKALGAECLRWQSA